MIIIKLLNQKFCRHVWGVAVSTCSIISGEQLYRRCKKCGKVEKLISKELEEMEHK